LGFSRNRLNKRAGKGGREGQDNNSDFSWGLHSRLSFFIIIKKIGKKATFWSSFSSLDIEEIK
jgi:hypothetical protein